MGLQADSQFEPSDDDSDSEEEEEDEAEEDEDGTEEQDEEDENGAGPSKKRQRQGSAGAKKRRKEDDGKVGLFEFAQLTISPVVYRKRSGKPTTIEFSDTTNLVRILACLWPRQSTSSPLY